MAANSWLSNPPNLNKNTEAIARAIWAQVQNGYVKQNGTLNGLNKLKKVKNLIKGTHYKPKPGMFGGKASPKIPNNAAAPPAANAFLNALNTFPVKSNSRFKSLRNRVKRMGVKKKAPAAPAAPAAKKAAEKAEQVKKNLMVSAQEKATAAAKAAAQAGNNTTLQNQRNRIAAEIWNRAWGGPGGIRAAKASNFPRIAQEIKNKLKIQQLNNANALKNYMKSPNFKNKWASLSHPPGRFGGRGQANLNRSIGIINAMSKN